MTPLLLLPGTHSGSWAEHGSDCRLFLRGLGYQTLVSPWSYDTDGIPSLTDYAGFSDWDAGGYSLRFLLWLFIARGVIRPGEIDVLSHSHGINVAVSQATLPPMNGIGPVQIRSLVSICAPPRRDVQPRYTQAREAEMIGFHRAVYADGWDFWARAGQVFDGSWGWTREWDGADENVGLKGIGHAGLLNDRSHFDLLEEQLDVRTLEAA